MKIFVYIISAILITTGCSGVHLEKKSTEQIRTELYPLLKTGDGEAIKKYFEDNSTCNNADALNLCYGREKGLPLGDDGWRIVSVEKFLTDYNIINSEFEIEINKCNKDVNCLANITLESPFNHRKTRICNSSSDGECYINIYRMPDGETLYTFHNIQAVLSHSYLKTELDTKFKNHFIEKAAEITEKNIPIIEAQKSKSATESLARSTERTKIYEQIKQEKCISLGSFSIVQKISANTYEIATPDRIAGGTCTSSVLGSCVDRTQSFINKGTNGILTTTHTSFESEGRLSSSFYGVYTGTKNITLSNGFTKKFPTFKESKRCVDLYKAMSN